MKEDYEKIWDALREFGRRLTGIPKEDNMQNINGQLVDVDAIEKLRGYYDAQLDASEWCFDVQEDEDFTIEIRKAQYDYMIDSIYNLKQRLTYASRHAKKLEEDKEDLIDEIHELKSFIDELQEYIIGQEYMSGWFDCLEKDGDLEEYEQDKLPAEHQLPFSYESLDKLYTIGITRPMLVEFAKKKYQEWKEKENEGIQLDTEGNAEE